MFKSEVRDATIQQLIEKVQKSNYRQYLKKIALKKVRGFLEEPVSFDFPVTAVIGPNGGGKTTVLGAAACAYKSIQPRRFFSKSGKYDELMQDWSIEYEIIDRKINQKDSFRRTATFKNRRWNRDAPNRHVLVFGVSRTVPANERTEMLQCARGNFNVPNDRIELFSQEIRNVASRILGKDISGYQSIKVDKNGRVKLLTGRTSDGSSYSEFHFGAGESSVIRMVSEIERSPDQTLVLIEEIENGLHPIATISLVEYLIDAASRKKIQVIFTTHSNDALKPLPFKAVWVATQNKIFQGKLDIQSLRSITGQVQKAGTIFVEDKFAKLWVEAILRDQMQDHMAHIEVHAMEGDGTAVALNRYHNMNPAIDTPSICIIDGDSKQFESVEDSVIRLPGEMPESYVFDSVLMKWSEVGGKLCVSLLQKYETTEKVREICDQIRIKNLDPHVLYSQVGERLGFVPELTVCNAFATSWCQAYPEEAKKIADQVIGMSPKLREALGLG